ncbi:o-succinylbenzoate synthase [Halobacillus locisalis]|uniref:o-succinylbenzoate synthase n=1 Tax=Halobacillus locisalis TaxID=220753 RepID=A0A838CUQ4_9BACI|nr:o-succinylbenzoate synthase [Halobacillus locisalis]MBA2175797.1 o-succinylbenzoate synthase [Halobacillus locisalis]
MEIDHFSFKQVELPLKAPFRTHQGTVTTRKLIIVEVVDRHGMKGYGEVTAFETPFYTYETLSTAWHVIKDVLLPALDWSSIEHPSTFAGKTSFVQGHPMAKAGIEGALWDLYSKRLGKSLSEVIGGGRQRVKAGAVLSLSDSLEEDLSRLKREGYERFKLKVEKGKELAAVQSVQQIDDSLPIMIDANGQYSKNDMDHLVSMDPLGLTMIEQPFQPGDFYLHQQLQQQISTPICLDESIMNVHDAVQAVQFNSCHVINIKISRVGGLTAAKSIHDYCLHHQIPVWCGGMVESGISKAHNLALASLKNFSIPGDLSSSTRYFERDIISPGITLENGSIEVPTNPGIGVVVDEEFLQHVTTQTYVYSI